MAPGVTLHTSGKSGHASYVINLLFFIGFIALRTAKPCIFSGVYGFPYGDCPNKIIPVP